MESKNDGPFKRRIKIGAVISFILVSGFFALNMVEYEEYPQRHIKLRINSFEHRIKDAMIPKDFKVEYKKNVVLEDKQSHAGGLWGSSYKIEGLEIKVPLNAHVFDIKGLEGNRILAELKFKSSDKNYDFKVKADVSGSVNDLISTLKGSVRANVTELTAKMEFELKDRSFGVKNAKVKDFDLKVSISNDTGLFSAINWLSTIGISAANFFGDIGCSSSGDCINLLIKTIAVPLIKPQLEAQANAMMKDSLKTLEKNIKGMLPKKDPEKSMPGFAIDEIPYIKTEELSNGTHGLAIVLPIKLSSLPFSECTRDFEIMTDNIDQFKGHENINEELKGDFQVFLGSGAILDVLHSGLRTRPGQLLCRKGEMPFQLANQKIDMEYETSPKLLKINANGDGEDTRITVRLEYDFFGKSVGAGPSNRLGDAVGFFKKIGLPIDPEVEFETVVFAEYTFRFAGNGTRGIFIRPRYKSGGLIRPVITVNGVRKIGTPLKMIFKQMIEPGLKAIGKKSGFRLPINPVIPLLNDWSAEVMWAGVHKNKGIEVRFEVMDNNMLMQNW